MSISAADDVHSNLSAAVGCDVVTSFSFVNHGLAFLGPLGTWDEQNETLVPPGDAFLGDTFLIGRAPQGYHAPETFATQ